MSATIDGVLMTTGASFMEHLTRFGNIRLLMLMAFMTWLHFFIFRLHLVMTCLTFSDCKTGMHLVLESDGANFSIEMDKFLVIRNSQFA